MSIDSVSAGLLLNVAISGGSDVAADLYKEMKNKNDGGPSDAAREFFKKNEGKPCKIKWTSHEAIVHSLNEATAGFYPGSRYPIKVKITNGESAGTIFEYDLDQVEVAV
jgi:hypothetical protein